MKQFSHQSGIAHLALIAVGVLLLVGLLGFVGYSSFNRQSSNAGGVSTVGQQAAQEKKAKDSCKKKGGTYFKDTRIKSHGPCWTGKGAYFINVESGVENGKSDDIQHVIGSPGKQSERRAYPNYIIVRSGGWKVCDDKFGSDICTVVGKPFKKGTVKNLYKNPLLSAKGAGKDTKDPFSYDYNSREDVYVERIQ